MRTPSTAPTTNVVVIVMERTGGWRGVDLLLGIVEVEAAAAAAVLLDDDDETAPVESVRLVPDEISGGIGFAVPVACCEWLRIVVEKESLLLLLLLLSLATAGDTVVASEAMLLPVDVGCGSQVNARPSGRV